MSIKTFCVDALGSALELGIAKPEDVLHHVTPDVLAAHLPRPLWARLLTACLGAPRVDAQLVVDTIGVPNLCEHVPTTIIWACIADIAARALGKAEPAAVARPAEAVPRAAQGKPASGPVLSAPPPPATTPAAPTRTTPTSVPVAIGPSIPPAPAAAASQPLQDMITELDQEERPPLSSSRPPTRVPAAQRFRQSGTASGARTLGGNTVRRPQAAAAVPTPSPAQVARGRRDATDVADAETETAVGSEWQEREIAVDDSQLIDWKTDAAGTALGDDDFSDLGRKR